LATIRQLHQTDDPKGQQLLARLLTYVRQSLAIAGASRTRLQDEVALVESYLAICQSRMADRLITQIDVPKSLENAEIPSLTLITLVENAIKHGLAPRPQGGRVCVVARRQGPMLEVLISDDGVGLGAVGSGPGIGLSNTLRRLRLSFGESAGLSVYANQPRGTCAQVRVPFRAAG
jgi:LytS/YehU family sensor histidine kinase